MESIASSSVASSVSSRRPNPFRQGRQGGDRAPRPSSSGSGSSVSSYSSVSRPTQDGYPTLLPSKSLPVDAMGRPACLSTAEPSVAAHLDKQETKHFLTKREKEHMYRGSAGVATEVMNDVWLGKGRKVFQSTPTVHDCIGEIAFNRTDLEGHKETEDYVSMFKDAGGLLGSEKDKHDRLQTKKYLGSSPNLQTEVPQLVFNSPGDRPRRNPETKTRLYENPAGMGRSDFNSKKTYALGAESHARGIIYGKDVPAESFHNQRQRTIKNDEGRAGQLSADRYR